LCCVLVSTEDPSVRLLSDAEHRRTERRCRVAANANDARFDARRHATARSGLSRAGAAAAAATAGSSGSGSGSGSGAGAGAGAGSGSSSSAGARAASAAASNVHAAAISRSGPIRCAATAIRTCRPSSGHSAGPAPTKHDGTAVRRVCGARRRRRCTGLCGGGRCIVWHELRPAAPTATSNGSRCSVPTLLPPSLPPSMLATTQIRSSLLFGV
jgi:hypothetical protein